MTGAYECGKADGKGQTHPHQSGGQGLDNHVGHMVGRQEAQADNFVEISLSTLYSTCYLWSHINLQCTNVDRPWCQLSAQPQSTCNHKWKITGYPMRAGRGCRHTLIKCTNCSGTQYATSVICRSSKQAVILGQSDIHDWRSME